MNNEKIVLQSAKPLESKDRDGRKFYLIAAECGFGLGIVLAFMIGANIWAYLLLGLFVALLAVPVGWGIRNKKLKYKCFGFRNMRFAVDEKPTQAELYQRLLPAFGSLGIKMEMNDKNGVCISHNGLYYNIVFNEDESFSVWWYQSLGMAFLRKGYYIGIYKKLLVSMGLIAYHVQRVCLNSNE